MGYQRTEEYALGIRCMVCEEHITPVGCRCSKDGLYNRSSAEVNEWLASLPAKLAAEAKDAPISPRRAAKQQQLLLSAAAQAMNRTRHRVGLRDTPHPDLPCSIDEDERMGFKKEHQIPIKWHPPQSRWTPRADAEPI